jgi:hypothetical protein
MPAMLDVIFSMIIGLTIVFIIINANIIVGEGWFNYNNEMLVQEMLISTATLIEGEFRNMGFGVSKTPTSSAGVIIRAERQYIQFTSDLNRTGTVDTLEYYIGDADELDFQNEAIRPLHRRVNSGAERSVGYVTEFQLRYFQKNGDEFTTFPIINAANIYMIEIEMEVQNPHALHRDASDGGPDAIYAVTRWRQTRLGSKNLVTR